MEPCCSVHHRSTQQIIFVHNWKWVRFGCHWHTWADPNKSSSVRLWNQLGSSLRPNVDGFEHDLSQWLSTHCDQEVHAVALSSGTAAIHLALIMLGGQRDEVICQSFTWLRQPTHLLSGCYPIFVDSEPDTWNMDPYCLNRPSATVWNRPASSPSHSSSTPLRHACPHERNLWHCLPLRHPRGGRRCWSNGAVYDGRYCGTFGQYGIFFNGNKMITTSGGGAFIMPYGKGSQRVKFYATQAREPFPGTSTNRSDTNTGSAMCRLVSDAADA